MWNPPSFDSQGNIYVGIANPAPPGGAPGYPWGTSRPGPDLYTDSVVKLSPQGRVLWYYQLTPHDLYDHDMENSPILTFANGQRHVGHDATTAALTAGMTRLRPVIMTALAMIIGMLPMSLSLGEGGEQNAPLGRAVIGGLSMATFATLFFVPVMYSLLRQKPPVTHVEKELM